VANTASDQGDPSFIEQDLPPTGDLGSFQPRIYFGENSPNYSIVGAPNSKQARELDLPANNGSGQQNTTYKGGGGVPVGEILHKLLYAWKFKDKNFLLSSGVNSDSRLLYIRNPRARVQKVAPWLTLDGDPYPVVTNGQVLWVVDGYTTSSGFPYSEQESLGSATQTSLTGNGNGVAAQRNTKINYIRNSVKATVNAYTGQVNLYAWQQSTNPDPVLKTWEKAFPGIIQSQDKMPSGLIDHLRYPEDLFNIQRTLLAQYHVTTPKTFYNGTEFWNVPSDPTVDPSLPAVPQPAYYYTLSQDGGTTAPVFSLTSPLVSLNRRNLTAFMSVNSDPSSPQYGHFTLLEVPSEQATPGPQQVQNNIESTTAVSQQLSLLRQGGSRVDLGNLLTVPLDGSFLYVEPIYVKSAGQGSFPELREVAAVYNNTVGYQTTLSAALEQAFGLPVTTANNNGSTTTNTGGTTTNGSGSTSPPVKSTTTLQQAIQAAQDAEDKASAALKRGDLGAYAKYQKQVQSALTRIAAAATASTSTTTKQPAKK
jgi:hypothetical protein